MRALSALVALSLIAVSVGAETFAVTEDTYTKSNDPSANFGTETVVRVQNWANITGFAKFDLSGSTQNSFEVATLRIPTSVINKDGIVEIYAVLGNWNEFDLSDNSRPALATTPAVSFLVTGAESGQIISVDITPLVNQWLANPSSDFGLALVPTSVNLWVNSRETAQGMFIEASAGQGSPQSTYNVSADSFTKATQSNTNFGSTTLVRVQKYADQTGFAKFNTGSGAPASVTSAALSFSANDVKKSGTITIHKVLGDWNELTLTDSTRPALASPSSSFNVSPADNGKTIVVDITNLFNQLLADPTSDFGIALAPGDVNLWIDSRESGSPMQITTNVGGPQPNSPPQVSAGNDQTLVFPAGASLSGSVTDDGLPNPPAQTTVNWDIVSGPGVVSFSNPGSISTTASFSNPGIYELRLVASDGELQRSDNITVSVTSSSTPRQSALAMQDSYTRSNAATTNFGSETEIRVQKWGNSTGFVKFDLSQYATSSNVSSAVLRLSVAEVRKNGNVSIHKVLGNWNELTLNDSNKPALGPASASFAVSSANSGQTVLVDITTLFNQLLTSAATDFGIALVPGDVNIRIESRESGTPMLIDTDSQPTPLAARNDDFATSVGVSINGNVIDDNGYGRDSTGQTPTTARLDTSPTRGQLSWVGDGSFQYSPDSGYSGTDSFSYSLLDSSGAESNSAQATISIRAQSTGKPNVLFFYADDMGWGDLATYNSQSKINMPNLERLANEGIRFMDAHTAASKCAPSRYSALTGNYQWRGRWGWGQWNYKGGSQIRSNQQTLGNMLQSAGYVTASIGKQHLGGDFYLQGSNSFASGNAADELVDFSRRFRGGPLDRGFDYSFNVLRGIQRWPYAYFENDRLVGNPADLQIWNAGNYGSSTINRTGIGMPYWASSEVGPDLVQAAIDFLDSHNQQNLDLGTNTPFFLYYASQSAHGPYTPPANLLGDPVKGVTGMNKHTDMIYEIDVALGALISAIESRGLINNTLIVFASDNGGIPNETRFGHDAVGGLRGRKGQIYEGGHRVPLIFKWGNGTPAGSTFAPGSQSNQLVAVQDVVATVAAIAGVNLPNDQALDSYDLLPILLGQQNENSPIRSSVVMEADDDETGRVPRHFAIRDRNWKLVFDGDRNPVALFNLGSDLAETNNRINDSAQQQRIQNMSDLLSSTLNSSRSAP